MHSWYGAREQAIVTSLIFVSFSWSLTFPVLDASLLGPNHVRPRSGHCFVLVMSSFYTGTPFYNVIGVLMYYSVCPSATCLTCQCAKTHWMSFRVPPLRAIAVENSSPLMFLIG